MFNKFRAPSMVLIIVDFTLPALAVLGLGGLIDKIQLLKEKSNASEEKQILKHLYTAGAVSMGLCLLIYIIPSLFLDFQSDSEKWIQMLKEQKESDVAINLILENLATAREIIVGQSALRSFGFILVAFGLIWAWIKYKFNPAIVVAPIILLTLVDLWKIDAQFMSDKQLEDPKTSPNLLLTPEKYDLEIMQREIAENPNLIPIITNAWSIFISKAAANSKYHYMSDMTKTEEYKPMVEFKALAENTNYRVLSLSDDNPFANARASVFHKNILGYSPIKVQRTNDIINRFYAADLSNAIMNVQKQRILGDSVKLNATNNILNMLNTKYITFKGNNGQVQVLENKGRNGGAWFVKSLLEVNTADDEIMSLDSINPKNTAVINKSFINDALKQWHYTSDSSARITQTGYVLNNLTYNYTANSTQLAVFSEIYDNDWHIYIDGKETPLLRIDYVLRGALIPSGNHKIEMRYEVTSLKSKTTVANVASYLLLLLGGVSLFFTFKPLKNKQEKISN